MSALEIALFCLVGILAAAWLVLCWLKVIPDPYRRWTMVPVGIIGAVALAILALVGRKKPTPPSRPVRPQDPGPVLVTEGPTEQEIELANERAATTDEKIEAIEAHEPDEETGDPLIGDFIRNNRGDT